MSDPERTLTFIGHLEELRSRLIWCISSWVVCTAAAFPLAPKAISMLTYPLEAATSSGGASRIEFRMEPLDNGGPNAYRVVAFLENFTTGTKRLDQMQVDIILPGGERRPIGEGAVTGANFYYTSLIDPIWLIFKAALILGIILALPVWVYHIWAFVSPGLKANEKAAIRPLFALSSVLFPIGVLFAYLMLKIIIGFLLSIQLPRVSPILDYAKYAPFAMKIMVGFGILFELPVAVLLLARLGIVTPMFLRKHRGHSYVVISIVAMMLTPPDPISMTVVMIPLFGLYELSIWLCRAAARKHASEWGE
ncbi:MAG: Sec-independent protein translocase protein TatCy [candidate division BRC1 bacterium ADurb.BinA364]|nr:MAG: Sec-independent protein translocase protein TatCy [candidate division BRC1 bacterium ADurb.BinA364]